MQSHKAEVMCRVGSWVAAVITISLRVWLLLSPFAVLSATSLPEQTAFSAWTATQREQATLSNPSATALAEGISIAQNRAAAMLQLLAQDSETFARLTMSDRERSALPAAVQPLIERRVRQRGAFKVFCEGLPDHSTGDASPVRGGLRREVTIDGVTYRTFAFGKWHDQKSVQDAWIEGVVLGDAIAIGDSPTPDEQAANGEPVIADAPSTTGANTLLYIIARFSDQVNDPVSETTAFSQMTVVSNFWRNNSSGVVSLRGLQNVGQPMDIVHVELPLASSSASTYQNNFALLLKDARDAAAAQGYNYASYNLDLVVTTAGGFSYAGRAYVGSQGAHCVQGYTSLRTVGHELGHNLGLFHANYWRTDATLPFGRDAVPGGYVGDASNSEWIEYGHYFSVMSAQYSWEMEDAAIPHYAAVEKVDLGWLSGNEVQYVNSSGSYRLFRQDALSTAGTPRAIRIESPASDYTGRDRRYWLNYRFAPWYVGSDWLRNGLQVDVCESSYGGDGAIQLDMTPFSDDSTSSAVYYTDNNDKRDGALTVGRTYSDVAAGIHITPIATGNLGADEEYIDLIVNLGTFPNNRPPKINSFTFSTNTVAANQVVNFSVTATDLDGDTLTYAWDFDQSATWTQSGLNSSAAAKSWPTDGQYRVTVTVSDTKGGVTTESTIITVGEPANRRQIWGRVLWGGVPVHRARVWTSDGSTVSQAWTDSDGSFVLTDLASANSYLIRCQRDGLTFTAQFANPVSLANGDQFGVDFYANEPLPSGGNPNTHRIAGQVTYAGEGISGVEVHTGGKLVMTDSSGNYQFTNFPPGNYTVTAGKDGWVFAPATRIVNLSTTDSSGNDFARVATNSISGRVDGLPTSGNSPAPVVILSNGLEVEATKQGFGASRYWGYTLNSVPNGQFSIHARLGGYLIQPNGFSNPLTVTGNVTNVNFDGTTASIAYDTISGMITERGLPLAGATVTARVNGVTVRTATSDSDGFYLLVNLTNAPINVLPSLAGYTFSPSSLNVSFVPNTGKNFAATSAATPPGIILVQASPSTVPNPGTTAALTVTAVGFAPLKYRWDALTAPAPVEFAINDSEAAATTAVSFTLPGNYLFRARVTDGNGFSTTANVGLTVNAGAGSMVVTPYETQISSGQTVQFSTDAWDDLGNPIIIPSSWSVTGGGTISSNGLFTATTAGGPFQITAVSGGLSATSTVWVSELNLIPPLITSPPVSQASPAGSNVTFTVAATGSQPLTYQWRYNGADIPAANASTYTRTNVQTSLDSGAYSVIVSNTAGDTESLAAQLTVNNFPQLDPIADLTIHAGATLIVSNMATDTDAPPQILSYSLLPGAPIGASINSTNGELIWNSALTDADTTKIVGVQVSDNGIPQLSATRSFAINVAAPLIIQSPTVSNSSITLSWSSIPGRTYQLQSNDAATLSSWTAIVPNIQALTPLTQVTDAVPTLPTLYRVVQLP